MPERLEASPLRRGRSALRFVLFIGVVSLFADMSYEGASGIIGPFVAFLGASTCPSSGNCFRRKSTRQYLGGVSLLSSVSGRCPLLDTLRLAAWRRAMYEPFCAW